MAGPMGAMSTIRQQTRRRAGAGEASERRINLARQARQVLWAAVFLMLMGSSALALNPGKAITQYMQTSWTSESGLPQNSVQAIAQTKDGYLCFGPRKA